MRDSEKPGRRATDVLASDIEQFVVTTKSRMHRIFIGALVSISIIALATTAALFGLGIIVKDNHSKASKVETIAKRADKLSQRSAIQLELSREKVCSQSSNRRVACRALFERLSDALSSKQRDRLACEVILHLRGPVAEALRQVNPQCK